MRKNIHHHEALLLNLAILATLLSCGLSQNLTASRTPRATPSSSPSGDLGLFDPEKEKKEIIFTFSLVGAGAVVLIVASVVCLLRERDHLRHHPGPYLDPVIRPPSPPAPSIFSSPAPAFIMTREEAIARLPNWRTRGVGGETADAFDRDVHTMMTRGRL